MAKFPLDSKRQGEWAEICFLHKATSLGFTVAKPYGENAKYDFIVDAGRSLHRVQVKSASVEERGLFQLKTTSGSSRKRSYTLRQVDFVAAYLLPWDTWYLIPIAALDGRKTIRRGRERPGPSAFERFREAWHLLRKKVDF
jgi:hypothetical protein